MFPVLSKPLIFSVLCIVATCQSTSAASRATRRPAKPLLHRSHESGLRQADLWVQKKNGSVGSVGSVVDEEGETTFQSMRLLPPPDMIIDSFLRSPHAPRASQRNVPLKQLVRSHFPSGGSGGRDRSGRRLSPPGTQRRPSDESSSSLSNEIESLVPGLSQLQKQAIPIDAISKDIEATIQRIVQDIVSRREKVFYQLPNHGTDTGHTTLRSTGNRGHGMRPEERMPVLRSLSRVPMRQLPPPPSAHRGLFSDSERPAGNELVPYYAIARNALGPGLKSFSDFVKKSMKVRSREPESENEGLSYMQLEEQAMPPTEPDAGLMDMTHASNSPPVASFLIEIPDGLELPVPDPSSPAQLHAFDTKGQPVTFVHSEWIGMGSEGPGAIVLAPPHRQGGGQRAGHQETHDRERPSAGSGSGMRERRPSFEAETNAEQISRINNDVLLPFFQSILGESNNRVGVYIPPSLTPSASSASSSSPSLQPPESHHAAVQVPATATTSYSSGMTGIRKKKSCPKG